MAQLLAKWPLKIVLARAFRDIPTKLQNASRPKSFATPRRLFPSRCITTTSVWARRRGGDEDGDGDDAPMSMAHAVRREMQQRRHKELMQKSARLAQYDRQGGEQDDGTVLSIDPDDLYQEIRRMDANTLLLTLEENHERLEPVHFPVAMRRLHQIRRQERDAGKREAFVADMLQDEAFQVLCGYLARFGPEYEQDVQVDMLQFLHAFSLDSDHVTVRVFLEMLKHSVHNLALDQIVQVGSTASAMTPTSQTRLLLAAMEVLVSSRLDELELLEGNDTIRFLELFGKSLKPNMLSAVLDQIRNNAHFGWKSALVLIEALDGIGAEDVEDLYEESVDRIVGAAQKIPTEDLLRVLAVFARQRLFCLDLVSVVAKRVTESNADGLDMAREIGATVVNDIKDIVTVGRLFHQQGYAHIGVLLRLAQAVRDGGAGERVEAGEVGVGDLREMLEWWGDAHFMLGAETMEEPVRNILEVIAQHIDAFLPDDLLEMCVHVQALQQPIPSAILEKLFSEEGVNTIARQVQELEADCISPCDLLLAVYTSNVASLPAPSPAMETVQETCRNNPPKPATCSIHGEIERVVEAKHLLAGRLTSTGMSVPLQVELDPYDKYFHRKDEYNFPIDKELDFVQKVAIVPLRGEHFTRQNGQMKSEVVVYARALQQLNYFVSVINVEAYKQVPVSARYDYIRDKVRGARKFQNLLMTGLDNPPHPQAPGAE